MKIYSKSYSDQATNIAHASPPLQVPAGDMTCFQIPFPSEGILEALVVSQAITDEYLVDASIELLNSKIPYPPGSYPINTSPDDTLDHYRVIPGGGALTAGDSYVLDDEDYGRAFRNIDGGWTLNQRYLYLVISPNASMGPQGAQDGGASIATNWNVTIRCRTDIN